jgi:hypothetical protein
MPSDLKTWERKHYTPVGGDALLWYHVYGDFEDSLVFPASDYRSGGAPAGLRVEKYGRETHPDTFNAFLSDYLGQRLDATLPDLADKVRTAPHCLILRGTFEDPPTLDYLRDSIGLLTCLLDSSGTALLDPQTFSWWEPSEWRAKIFTPDGEFPRHHVVILYSEDGDKTEWFHTRGMRKFGRPDLSVHQVTAQYRRAIIDLFERFIELQAFGGTVPEGQVIRMANLPIGMTCHHSGDIDDPEFNNVHVEICWPKGYA